MRKPLLIVVCLFLSMGLGHAQSYKDGMLRGLTELNLLIEVLDSTAQACGITDDLIRESFLFPVSSTALKITKTNVWPMFYINVITIRTNAGLCASTINFQVYEFSKVTARFSNVPRNADVVFWHDTSLNVSGQNTHGKQIRDGVEAVTKKFLTRWNLDNRPQ